MGKEGCWIYDNDDNNDGDDNNDDEIEHKKKQRSKKIFGEIVLIPMHCGECGG